MDNGTGIMPVMPIGSNDAWGGGSFMWIFALIILMGMFNGGGFGWGNNAATALGYENLATSNELQRGFDNQNAMANQRDILAAVTNGTAQTINAVNGTFHDTVNALSDKYSELARDVAGVQMSIQQSIANENQCCCATKMQIAESTAGINAGIADAKYASALNTAAINETTVAQTQRILDAISQNKIEALQAQVSELQLQNQLASVVRYPSNTFYSVPSPCFGCGCGA